jgi:hypothetical protein
MTHLDLADPFAPTRRSFLRELGGSVGLLGLASYLQAAESPVSQPAPLGKLHFPPRIKQVIFLFMAGGPSHLDTFDPKPALARHAGQAAGERRSANRADHRGAAPFSLLVSPGWEVRPTGE